MNWKNWLIVGIAILIIYGIISLMNHYPIEVVGVGAILIIIVIGIWIMQVEKE